MIGCALPEDVPIEAKMTSHQPVVMAGHWRTRGTSMTDAPRSDPSAAASSSVVVPPAAPPAVPGWNRAQHVGSSAYVNRLGKTRNPWGVWLVSFVTIGIRAVVVLHDQRRDPRVRRSSSGATRGGA